MKDKSKDIISKMEMLERDIGHLYKIFASIFPSSYSFWIQLYQEEEEHARLLGELEKQSQYGKIFFDDTRFSLNAIQTTIRYVMQKISEANNNIITEQDALNIAWDIENGLLEKNFFKNFKTDDNYLTDILKKIISDTEKHRNRVSEKKNKNIF